MAETNLAAPEGQTQPKAIEVVGADRIAEYLRKRDSKTGPEIVNDAWDYGLKMRKKYESWWADAYLQYISKNEKPVSGFSTFFLSLTFSQIRALAPEIWMNHVSDKPYVFFYPNSPYDANRYRVSESVVNTLMDEGDFPIELLHAIYMLCIYGDAWIKHTWYREMREFELPSFVRDPLTGMVTDVDFNTTQRVALKTFDGVKYEVRSPWRIVIDPASYSPRPNRCRWIIDTEPRMPIETLYEMQAQGILYNVDKIDPDGWVDMFRGSNNAGDNRQSSFPGTNDLKMDMSGLVFIREYWDNQNNRIIIANQDVELYRGKSPLLAGAPFTHFGLQNMPLEPYSMGIAKQLEYTQKLINSYAEMSIDEQALRVYTPVVMGPGVSFRSGFNRLTPGIIVHGPTEDVKYLERPQHQTELFNAIGFFDLMGQRISGVSLSAEGVVATQGDPTATATSVAAAAHSKFSRFLTRMVGMAIGKMAIHNNMTALQLMGPRSIKMVEEDLQPIFEFVRNSQLATNPGVNVKEKSVVASRQEQLTMMIALLDRMMPRMGNQIVPETGQVLPGLFEEREVWIDIFKLAGLQNYPRYFSQNIMNEQMQMMIASQINQARGRGAFSAPRGQVPGGQTGNRLGMMASERVPQSNNRPGNTSNDRLAGIR